MAKKSCQKSKAKEQAKTKKLVKADKKDLETHSVDNQTHEESLCDWENFHTSFYTKEVKLIDYANVEIHRQKSLFEELLGEF